MLKGLRSNWITFTSSLMLLAAIGYILSKQDQLGTIVDVWRQIDKWYFALAVLLTLVLVHATGAWRLRSIMSFDGVPGVRFRSIYRIQLISLFVAHGAPISAIADLARAAMVNLRYRLTAGRSVRLVLYERICAAIGAVILGLVASIALLAISAHTKLIYGQLVFWAGSLAGVCVLLAIGSLTFNTRIKLINRVVQAIDILRQMLRRPAMALLLMLISVVQLLSFAVVYIVLAHSMELAVPWWYIVLYMPLIFFVSSLPIFYLGWGGREAIIIFAMGDLGTVTTAQSIALSIAFGVVMLIASVPGALVWLMRPSMRKAVKLEVEQA
jgi:glycosyltransferase 2 family protein